MGGECLYQKSPDRQLEGGDFGPANNKKKRRLHIHLGGPGAAKPRVGHYWTDQDTGRKGELKNSYGGNRSREVQVTGAHRR